MGSSWLAGSKPDRVSDSSVGGRVHVRCVVGRVGRTGHRSGATARGASRSWRRRALEVSSATGGAGSTDHSVDRHLDRSRRHRHQLDDRRQLVEQHAAESRRRPGLPGAEQQVSLSLGEQLCGGHNFQFDHDRGSGIQPLGKCGCRVVGSHHNVHVGHIERRDGHDAGDRDDLAGLRRDARSSRGFSPGRPG